MSVVLRAILPVTRVHAAAQQSMGEAGRNGRGHSCAQQLTARTALVPCPTSKLAAPRCDLPVGVALPSMAFIITSS